MILTFLYISISQHILSLKVFAYTLSKTAYTFLWFASTFIKIASTFEKSKRKIPMFASTMKKTASTLPMFAYFFSKIANSDLLYAKSSFIQKQYNIKYFNVLKENREKAVN